MRMILAGIASLALAATMAQAQSEKGKGQGKGKQGAQTAQLERGPGAKADKRGGPGNAGGKADRGPQKVNANANADANSNRGNQGQGKAEQAVYRGNNKGNAGGNGRGNDKGNGKGNRGPGYDRDGGLLDRVARLPYASNRGLIDGCPPGLRKKNPPCVPPGQARKQGYYSSGYYRPSLFGLIGLGDGRYYYNDGYLMRMGSNNLVSAFIPLLGGALGIGNTWPSYYQPAPVPNYYRDYYRLEPRGYRYADNVLYRVDPETAAITSVAALLTGDDIRVGQPMPAGYGAYNVPHGYRDRYYDRPDAHYRYSDGYIYQVDPETRLVAAAIELLI